MPANADPHLPYRPEPLHDPRAAPASVPQYKPERHVWSSTATFRRSILSRSALQGASFTSVEMLIKAIEAFIAKWNQNAAPFEWTKREVHQQGMKHYANLRR